MKTVNKMIKEHLAKNECDLNSHLEVLEILKSVEGKQFNFRTFSKKVLPDKFEFNSSHGQFHIFNKIDKQNHLIGYHDQNGVDSSKFYNLDCCYSKGSEERIEKLKNLDIKKLIRAQKLLSKNFNAIRDLFGAMDSQKLDSFDNPIYHDLLKSIFDHESSNNRDNIKLYEFHYIRTHNKKVVL
tara:strand:- start:1376 stop:1924 length:549 start_codon:yes stop_codon:yes gene_type:complete